MYNIKLENYVPEPKPATSDRIVAAHYYAAWKKGAARIHEAFDDLHEFPERTPLHGYYDEENPELCDWEIKWALEHGINCFIYCWYRNLDNMGKPITDKDLRCGHCIHESLFNSKYGDKMKFAIMFENSPRWGTTDPEDIIENVMPFWMENYFKRENYLIIDNKPVVFVFSAQRLLEALGGIEGQAKAFEACREYARKHGFDGMLFAKQDWHTSEQIVKDDIASGYDIRFGYNSGYAAPYNFPPEEDVVNAQVALLRKKINDFPMGYIPTASCFSDATPRTTQHWIDMGYNFHKGTIYYLSPDNYRRVIRKMKALTDSLPEGSYGRKIFMIDNWNEWDEGHYVSPSHEFGFRYLQAIREELTERDNLPDYRMPQDIGLSNFNKSWGNPDLSEICKKKFGVTYDK